MKQASGSSTSKRGSKSCSMLIFSQSARLQVLSWIYDGITFLCTFLLLSLLLCHDAMYSLWLLNVVQLPAESIHLLYRSYIILSDSAIVESVGVLKVSRESCFLILESSALSDPLNFNKLAHIFLAKLFARRCTSQRSCQRERGCWPGTSIAQRDISWTNDTNALVQSSKIRKCEIDRLTLLFS